MMQAVGLTGLEVFHDEWYKDSKVPYYHSDEEKNELLRTSDALKDHRTEIASFFADHEDNNERADVKRENEIVDGEPDEGGPKEKKREMER